MAKMQKKIIIPIIVLLCFSAEAQERIFQLWNQNKLDVQLSERTSVGVSEKIHYVPENGNISLKFGDITVKQKLTEWFELGATGRILWISTGNGWLQEQRPMAFGNVSTSLGKFEFDFSNRFEFRMYKILDDHFRHRQMFSIELPPFYSDKFKVYVSEEGFYRFDPEKLHLFRFYAGTKMQMNNYFELKFYYVFEKLKKNPSWLLSDILGFNLSVEL
jgi:hypothetical protein